MSSILMSGAVKKASNHDEFNMLEICLHELRDVVDKLPEREEVAVHHEFDMLEIRLHEFKDVVDKLAEAEEVKVINVPQDMVVELGEPELDESNFTQFGLHPGFGTRA